MVLSSAPKAASKLLNIGSPSIQSLFRPSAATSHLLQSPTTKTSAADSQLFTLLQPDNERADPPRNVYLRRELGIALNSQPPFGYSAAHIEAARKPAAPPSDAEDDFSDVDDEEMDEFVPESIDDEDLDDSEIDGEDEEPEDLPPPRRARK